MERYEPKYEKKIERWSLWGRMRGSKTRGRYKHEDKVYYIYARDTQLFAVRMNRTADLCEIVPKDVARFFFSIIENATHLSGLEA